MMLKLLKSYNLLFLPIALLLLGSTSLYAQTGNPSNFSIYGDLYTDTPSPQSLGVDDWFKSPTIIGLGNGQIDETRTAEFRNETDTRSNKAFTVRSPYRQYKELNGFLLYDAIYGRDHVELGPGVRDNSAFLGQSGKNTDNPKEKWDLGTYETVNKANDLVDVYAHLRRAGMTVGQNMWLNLGVSTYSNSGDHYVDFELYKSPIALNGTKTKFINSGPDSEGGHSAWKLDAQGNITSSGDMIAAFNFNGASVSAVKLRIWTHHDTWKNITPKNFNWGEFIEGDQKHGYAEVIIPASNPLDPTTRAVYSKGNSVTVPGPPWGTFDSSNSGTALNYAPGYFVEVAINLSVLGIDPSLESRNPCDAPFTKLLVKSRSSSSFTSSLKDFAGPYNFLGSSVVKTEIQPMSPRYFTCGQIEYNLSPKEPQIGAYYVWSTVDGLFDNGTPEGTKTIVGENVIALKPGTYTLAAAPLEGCTESSSSITLYAAPCANPDAAEVIENKGPKVIEIVLNDTDEDTDLFVDGVLKTASFLQPSNGIVTMNQANKTVSYTPNPGFYGVDTFEYRICDDTPNANPDNGPYCSITLVTVMVLRDSDNDGIPDRDDLDSDNDGIPDTIELQCAPITSPNLIQDPDFENVNIVTTGLDGGDTDKVPTTLIWKGSDTNIPSWKSAGYEATPNPNDLLELWHNGYDNSDGKDGGTGSFSGDQFVEVSATGDFGLFQDIPTTPGDVLRWTFAHRNRLGTDDVIEILLGSPTGTLASQGTYTSAASFAWKEHEGYYVVPAGQTTTRVRFKTIVGSNFIDLVKVHVFNPCYDFDADGIPNYLDLDSDNDGLPDVFEAGFIDTNNNGLLDDGENLLPDSDNDGLVDTIPGPTPYGLNGLADNVETSPDSGIINYTLLNSDASSDANVGFILYNFMDVDSDNDGISDTTEAFSNNSSYNDIGNDGRIDGFVDNDLNGWHDLIDAEPTLPSPLNSDSDHLFNFIDLDSDGDGIPDTVEANFDVEDADNDGIVGEGIPLDDDKDGLANTNDPHFPGNILGGPGFNKDRDNDGVLNYLDIDYDNDGIIDNTEAQSTFAYIVPSGSDTDGDGIDDAYDIDNGGFAIGYINTDGGWAPDYADTNSDDDAEYDLVENHFDNSIDVNKDTVINSNGNIGSDGMIDPGEPDTDGDGLVDIFDLVNGVSITDNATNGGQTPLTQPDLENPGNDRDWREQVVNDNDNDGFSDLNDEDDDNDGILDITEGQNDLDGDGLMNSFDLDSDGDGIPDHIEAGGIFDGDGNGTPGTGLLIGTDVNNVGVPLQVVAPQPAGFNGDGTDGLNPIDTDLDGHYDYLDLDSDNDGIGDVIEAGGIDPDGNGVYGAGSTNDLDSDGLADAVDILYNNDNPSTAGDELGTVLGGTPLTVLIGGIHQVKDSDGDGHPDNLDLDSDNDTVPDIVEAQTTTGYVAYSATDANSNGLKDVYDIRVGGIGIIPVDTDGDGTPDYLDLDSDDEGGFDIVEANAVPVTDANGDGRTDAAVGDNGLDDAFDNGDTYADSNGKHDDTQFDNFPDNDADVLTGGDVDFRDATFSDIDGDGIADSIDLDNDNDGIPDLDENGGDFLLDTDGDGIPNHLDLDSDNDGCSDALEAGATTNTSDNYQFPNTPVGSDGIPDAVQDSGDSETINYSIKQTSPSTIYDFLNTSVFVACKADLSLVKTVKKSGGSPSDNLNAQIGDVIVFTLTLTNDGPFSVINPQVQDILPEGLINISVSTTSGSYDPTTGIWDLKDITLDPSGAGSIKELQITATIGPNCGTITNTAKVYYSNRADPDSTPTSNTKY